MMKASHIFLRPEITREDAIAMMRWMDDGEVTEFLHEGHHTSQAILEAVNRSGLPTVTHLFNQNGRFFMICPLESAPVGFLRLQRRPQEAEMVIVIGEKQRWGHGMGTVAIDLALKHAFFEWRVARVVANIHPQNERSLRAFHSAGFAAERALPNGVRLCIAMEQYLKRA